nr:hypothetical protein [Nanoarchaeota archaeon]
MKKKASMQLGINAIVILIIALAVLGLAMSFITGLFRQSGAKYSAIIDRTDLPFHADIVTPIIFETKEVTVKAGRQESLTVSVFNDKFNPSDPISLELVNCIDPDGQEAWPPRDPLYDPLHYSYPDYKCLNNPTYPYDPTIAIRTSPQT